MTKLKSIRKTNEFTGIFEGKETRFVGEFKLENDHLYYMKKNKLFPFMSQWVLAIWNTDDLLKDYNECFLVDYEQGITSKRVLVFPIDWYTKKKDMSKVDSELHLEVNSMRAENDLLQNELSQMKNYLEEQGMFEIYLERHKKINNSIASMKTGVNIPSSDKKKK